MSKDVLYHSAYFIPQTRFDNCYRSPLIKVNVIFVRVSKFNMRLETKSPTPTFCVRKKNRN